METYQGNRFELYRTLLSSHALFNSLSSLQNFIAFDEKREAFSSLSAFAKFLRLAAQVAKSETTSVETEISFLDNYLTLEKLRFGADLTYHLRNPLITDAEAGLPVFLIQPIAEQFLLYSLKSGQKPVELDISLRPQSGGWEVTFHSNLHKFPADNSFTPEQSERIRLLDDRVNWLNSHGWSVQRSRSEDTGGCSEILIIRPQT